MDHLLLLPDRVVLVECKLTQHLSAIPQLTKLYKPLAEKVFDLPAVCVVAYKIATLSAPRRQLDDIAQAITLPVPSSGAFFLHWIG